jgi:hypothetical protein
MEVINERHNKVIKALLEGGADPNLRNHNGQTALNFAAARGYEPIVMQLLKAGADAHQNDNFGRSAIDRAQNSQETIIEGLLLNWPVIVRETHADAVIQSLDRCVKAAGACLGTGSAVGYFKNEPPAKQIINTIRLKEFHRIHSDKTFLNNNGSVHIADNEEAETSKRTLEQHYDIIREDKEKETAYIAAKMKDENAVRDGDELPPFVGTRRCLRRGAVSTKAPIVNMMKRRRAAAALASDAFTAVGNRPASISTIHKRPNYDMNVFSSTLPWGCTICTKTNRSMDEACACCSRKRPEQLDLNKKLGLA